MSFADIVNVYFVHSKTDSEEFVAVETLLLSHMKEDAIRHIRASEGYPLIASAQLTKRDVFVFEQFEGEFFQQLQLTKSLIIGPRCLQDCLQRNESIPMGKSPIFTTAMRGVNISASGITPEAKEQIRTKVQWMGGYYFQNFGRNTTHLISNTIKSNKYEQATLNGIPVMHVDWVQRVWERSLVDFVAATDTEFDRYRLPIFFGTNITSTSLDSEKRDKVMQLVQENGGIYHRTFRSQLVDIVITEKDKTGSEKYQAAIRYKKDVLLPEWIFDSVQKGFALPTKNYQVKSLKVSTPTKTDQSIADFTSTDHTQLSEISRICIVETARRGSDVTVDDSMCPTSKNNEAKSMPPPTLVQKESSKNLKKDLLKKNTDNCANYRTVLEEISPREAKKAGNFLDGCSIFLSGFRAAEKEKLHRILNVGGATRYDALNGEITHIIVGQLDDADFKLWKNHGVATSVHIVRLDWLLESIKQKQTANENNYRISIPTACSAPDAPSPSSKKTLRSMNHSFKQTDVPTKKKLFDTSTVATTSKVASESFTTMPPPPPKPCSTVPALREDEHELLAQYSQENMAVVVPLPPTTADSTDGANIASELLTCSVDYANLNVFRDLIIYVDKDHFASEFYSQMQHECEAAHGNVIESNFRDPVDYAIVSFEHAIDITQLPVKAKYVVNELYVEICVKENRLMPIEYYHQPIPHTADTQPLKGMVIVISVYTGLEREFIDSLAKLLGAQVMVTYSKKTYPMLICPSPEGAKYEGAMKWRFPVVKSAWLVQCAKEGIKVGIRPYLVGDSPENFPTTTDSMRNNFTSTSVTPLRSRAIQDLDSNVEITPLRTPYATSVAARCELPSEITPLRNKRVSELASMAPSTPINTSSCDSPASSAPNMDSPHTPANNYNRPAYSIEFMESLLADIEDPRDRECVRGIIEDIRANPTPELERIKRQVCTPINRKATPKELPYYFSTPEFRKRMVEAFDKRWKLPTKKLKPSTPIDQIRKRVLYEACKNLGIPVSEEEMQAIKPATPIVTPRLPTRNVVEPAQITPLQTTASPFSRSRMQPRAIFNASNRRSSANGSFIPGTQEDALQQQPQSSSNQRERASLLGKSSIDFDKINFDETDAATLAEQNEAAQQSNSTAAAAVVSPELQQIQNYLRERESRRRSARDAAHKRPLNIETMETDGVENLPLQAFESEQLGCDSEQMVAWRDPIEFHRERQAKKVSTMQYKGTPRFSMSCLDDTLAQDVIAKIYKLGGEVCKNLMNFDPECTHFICERPNRGEKILGCLASGKWVLSLRYIEECYAKDTFIDEELYEWGNPKALNLPAISPDDQVTARAAYRWRKELSSDHNTSAAGIFAGMRAILCVVPKNLEAFTNVLTAGKCEVIAATSPYRQCPIAHTATHCFVDMKKSPITQDDYMYLRGHNVKIVSFLYIQTFLFNGQEADLSIYDIKL